jgi:hypothetical protein
MIATVAIEPRMPNPMIMSFVPTSLLFQSMTQSSSRVRDPTARLAPQPCSASAKDLGLAIDPLTGIAAGLRSRRPLLWTKSGPLHGKQHPVQGILRGRCRRRLDAADVAQLVFAQRCISGP